MIESDQEPFKSTENERLLNAASELGESYDQGDKSRIREATLSLIALSAIVEQPTSMPSTLTKNVRHRASEEFQLATGKKLRIAKHNLKSWANYIRLAGAYYQDPSAPTG